jgi:C4-dicarboxylate-specific signal transduction histidine kinase
VNADKSSRISDPDALGRIAHQLGERVKELNCLFGVSDIVERAEGSLERIMEETVELLRESWDHADVSCARIVLEDMEVRSKGYREPVATQAAQILVRGREAGKVEISYAEPRAERDEGPFTREERRLLNAVAERLGHVVERLTTQEYLRAQEEEFRRRMTHVTRVSTMGELASSIAHEVNQPLTAIATYAQACRRFVEAGMLDAPEALEVLEKIGEEALRAGDIIRRLRNLVQRREIRLDPCDVIQLLREVDPLASLDARLNDVELRMILPKEEHIILADGVQIQQVVLNLIRNGVDAMSRTPPGERILEVRVLSPDEDSVRVSVLDRGSGIPDVSEEELFEPFFTTKETGLGLGLSISRSIVTAHGGRLSFFRNPNRGSTFFVDLPRIGGSEDE